MVKVQREYHLAGDWAGLLARAMSHVMSDSSAEQFKVPVPKSLYMYYDVIFNPMDMGTVRKGLVAGRYQSPVHVLSDVSLVRRGFEGGGGKSDTCGHVIDLSTLAQSKLAQAVLRLK